MYMLSYLFIKLTEKTPFKFDQKTSIFFIYN